MTTATTTRAEIRIGTRGSPLALAQAELVKAAILAAHDGIAADQVEIVKISTKGDRITDRPLAEIGGKGLFTEEIEAGLEDRSLDIAVHSMKDMPTELPGGLVIDCILPREDPRDGLISRVAESIEGLPQGAMVGSASLRRGAQVMRLRPDIKVVSLRGNVATRLGKLDAGEVDATFLAMAGLNRLGIAHEATAILNPDVMLPAIAQGAIGIEQRTGDDRITAILAPLNDDISRTCVTAERAFLRALDGSCRTPIAGLATIENGTLRFRGEILSPDGNQHFATSRTGAPADADAMGFDAGDELRKKAGPGFFDESP